MVLARRKSSLTRMFDWTRESRTSATTSFQKDFQKATRENVDWTKSPLGPISEWPSSLRQMVLMSMADTTASAVIYGPVLESAIVYNEAFAELIGKRHPSLQGQVFKDMLVDLCPEFDATWRRQTESGRVEILDNQRVRQEKLGFIEEKTYTWKLLPMIGDEGLVVGSLVTVEDENKTPPRRERSKSAVREIGNVVRGAIDRTTSQTAVSILRLDEHFSGRACSCEKIWELQGKLDVMEARYEKFGNLAPVGIASLQVKNGYFIEWANHAYWDVMAQPRGSQSFLDFIYPEDVAKVQENFELGSFREGSYSFQCRLKKWAARAAVSPSEAVPEVSPAWVLVSAYQDPDHANLTMCWIIDITSHKIAESFLRERMDEAVEEKKQKERFIDQISHEIRNPLSSMIHCTDDIIANTREDVTRSSTDILEAAQTIAFCTHHIKAIVDDVSTLSKLDSRLVDISPTSTRPREIIQEAMKMFQRELQGVKLTFEEDRSVEDHKVDWLLMDPNRYLQVLFNVVANAINAVKGREERRISVRLSAATSDPATGSGTVQFVAPRQHGKPVNFGEQHIHSESLYLITTVEDTGPGLTSGEIASLMERFAQKSPKTESKYGGSGLGLFISRDLTELQGGRIGVASEAGSGVRFIFSVESKRCGAPVEISRAPSIHIPARLQGMEDPYSPVLCTPPESLHSQDAICNQPELNEKDNEKPKARKVLVVEDNIINQKVLANQLKKRGYDVSVALHGEEALSKLHMATATSDLFSIPRKTVASATFDIVLMDIEMPVMDGLTCAQRIRAVELARGGRNRLPIIAVTANVRSEHGTAALEAGMDSVTTKPYKIDDLVIQIEEACNSAG